ncbi:hypothetical protein CW706_05690 [Candidatus Bathyarchaeota archaeon]|nr:MAG: hypothetical protein CW706_05690 [Candidatus Bathyarchaeota archaeon]
MFIDIHVHVRRIPGPPHRGQYYPTPDQLIEIYDRLEIEKGVLLPEVNPECAYVIQSNEEVIEIAEKYPGRFIPFCNVDPRFVSNSPDAPLDKVLKYYCDHGCKGVGEVCANLPFLHPLVQNLFRHVQDFGLPLTFHIAPQMGGAYGLYDDPGLPQLERSLQLFPKLIFLGHSQPFWAEIGRLETPADRYGYPDYPVGEEGVVPKLMRRYSNLYGDLSANSGYNALARDPEYAVKFLNEFQDRLLFGTDITSPSDLVPLRDFLLKLYREGRISEKVFWKVSRGNAIRLLGLDD